MLPRPAAGVLVKAPKPQQDRRFDLPAIGPRTVEEVARAGLAGIAVVAGGAIVAEPAAVATAADKAKVFVVGIKAPRPMSRPLKLFLVAAEELGDVLGGALMGALRALRPDISFGGVGGRAMQSLGLEQPVRYRGSVDHRRRRRFPESCR